MTKGPLVRTGLIGAVAVAAAALLPIVVASRDTSHAPRPREITIVAKDMTFYLNGEKTPNPTLRFRAGEQIRLVLRNEDPGMKHDFVLADWKVSTKTLDEKGQQDAVEFRVPDRRGTSSYKCTPHSQMMSGAVEIE